MAKVFDEERGWFKAVNRLVDGPVFAALGAYGFQLLAFIIRRTQGYNQTWATISYRDFARELGWSSATVAKYLAFLQGHDHDGREFLPSPFKPENAPIRARSIGGPRGSVVSTAVKYALNTNFDDEDLRDGKVLEPFGRFDPQSVTV